MKKYRARGLTIVEVLFVLTLLSMVVVPVLGLGTVDQRTAKMRLERIERLAAMRALAEQLAARSAAELTVMPPPPGVAVDASWIAARAPGVAFAPVADGASPCVRVAFEPDVEGARDLHRLTVTVDAMSGPPHAVVRLVEGR